MAAEPGAASAGRATLALQRLQESYAARLDKELKRLLEGYAGMLRAARLDELQASRSQKASRPGRARNDLLQSHAQNLSIEVRLDGLISAAQALQRLVEDTRHLLILGDLEAAQAQLDREARLAQRDQQRLLHGLALEVDHALLELEAAGEKTTSFV
jgi:hypothetical protein